MLPGLHGHRLPSGAAILCFPCEGEVSIPCPQNSGAAAFHPNSNPILTHSLAILHSTNTLRLLLPPKHLPDASHRNPGLALASLLFLVLFCTPCPSVSTVQRAAPSPALNNSQPAGGASSQACASTASAAWDIASEPLTARLSVLSSSSLANGPLAACMRVRLTAHNHGYRGRKEFHKGE